jgi:TonB family protein
MGVAFAQAVDTVAARPGDEGDSASLLQDWDRQQIQLRESVWRTYVPTAALDQDSRGRTIADDLNAWVMTKDVQDRLSSMREAAQRKLRAGDEQGARQTLESGRAVVQEQRRVFSMLNYYWVQRIELNRQRDLWLTWITLSPDGVAAQSKQRIDPLEAALIHNFSPTTTQPEMTQRVASLKRAYDQERIKLAALVSDQRVAEGKPVAARERRTACPATPPQPTGHERNGSKAAGNQPVTIAMDMSPGRFYPEAARRSGVSGTVDLRLTIGPTGCMERAEVLRSSGAEELDQAGRDVEAMRAFDRAVEISPDESTYQTRATYRHRTDLAGERSDIDAAMKLNPHSIQASISIAKMQSAAGDYAGALDTLGIAMASQTDNYYLLTARGIVYAKSGQAALAELDFAAARKFATTAAALNNICWAKATAGVALDTALAECDASVAEAPYDSAAQDSRGFVLLRLGRNSEAIASYDIALKIRPLSAASLYGRGLAKRRQGKLDEANTDIRAALLGDAHIAETFAEFGLAQ